MHKRIIYCSILRSVSFSCHIMILLYATMIDRLIRLHSQCAQITYLKKEKLEKVWRRATRNKVVWWKMKELSMFNFQKRSWRSNILVKYWLKYKVKTCFFMALECCFMDAGENMDSISEKVSLQLCSTSYPEPGFSFTGCI